jgi:hypothetical protein
MSDLDDWLAKRKAGQTAPKVETAPATTGGSDLDQWLAKRKQVGPSGPRRVQYSPAPPGADLLAQAEAGSRQASGMVGDLPPGPGLGENVKIGAQRAYYNRILPAVSSLVEVTQGMQEGNFSPLLQMTKEAARGTYEALKPPSPQVTRDPSGNVTGMQLRPDNPAIVAAQQQRQQRYQAGPDYRRAQAANQRLNERARLDPSITGKLTRGASEVLTSAAPTIAAGAAGGVPGVMLATAAMSADNPSQMGPNAALAALPMPGVGAAVRRLRGKPQAQAPAAPTQQPLFKGAPAPVREQPSLGSALGDAVRTGSQGLRTVKTSFDLSAPLSQGAVLTAAHPLKSARAFGQMLRSLSPTKSKAIDDAIMNHPLRQIGEDSGLYLATGNAFPEEAYMLKALNKVPGIGASERTYRTYLDSLRLSVWESYVKSLQASGASPTAYRQAASFINIATGRGSLRPGGAIENAMKLGGDILFAPRNLVSKFQLLDPVRYATLAPGARKLVLRDATTAFGAILGTATLLQAAGARVSLDPESDEFLTARSGNHRYDLSFGTKAQVQFLARMLASTYRQANGDGNLPGKDPLSIAGRYGRGKLSPGVGLAFDALKGSDFKGEKFSDKSGLTIARETGAPMIVNDLIEGFEDSGLAGLLKSTPAILGQRVNTYPDRAKADWLSEPAGFRQPGEKRMYLEPKRGEGTEPDETPQAFSARKQNVDSLLNNYGRKLLDSKAYKSATTEEKTAMREYLRRQIGREGVNVGLFDPARILGVVRESAYQKNQRARGR